MVTSISLFVNWFIFLEKQCLGLNDSTGLILPWLICTLINFSLDSQLMTAVNYNGFLN